MLADSGVNLLPIIDSAQHESAQCGSPQHVDTGMASALQQVTAQHGSAQHGSAQQHGMGQADLASQQLMLQRDSAQHDLAQPDSAQHDSALYDPAQHDLAEHDSAEHVAPQHAQHKAEYVSQHVSSSADGTAEDKSPKYDLALLLELQRLLSVTDHPAGDNDDLNSGAPESVVSVSHAHSNGSSAEAQGVDSHLEQVGMLCVLCG